MDTLISIFKKSYILLFAVKKYHLLRLSHQKRTDYILMCLTPPHICAKTAILKISPHAKFREYGSKLTKLDLLYYRDVLTFNIWIRGRANT